MLHQKGATPPALPQPVDDPSLLGAVVRRPFVAAAVLLLGVAVGAALPVLRAAEPVATAVLLLEADVSQLRGDERAVKFVRAQAALARLPVVSRQAAAEAQRAAGPAAPPEPADALRVVLPRDRAALRFSYRAANPDVARAGVNAAVRAYRDLRAQQLRRLAEAQLQRLDRLAASLNAAGEGRGVSRARARLADMRVDALLIARGDAASEGILLATEVDRPFTVPPGKGAAAGLLAAVFPAVLLAHRLAPAADRQRAARGAAAVVAAPLLASVTHYRPQRLSVADAAESPAATGFLLAFTALPLHAAGTEGAHAAADAAPPVIAVVDASDEGIDADTVTANLALAARSMGHSVLIVSRPGAAVIALLAPHAGGGPPRGEPGRRTGVLDIVDEDVVFAGPVPYDVVLVDAAALLTSSARAASLVDADLAVIVVPAGTATSRLTLLRRRVDDLGLTVGGCVFLEPAPSRLHAVFRRRRHRGRAELRRPSTPAFAGTAGR